MALDSQIDDYSQMGNVLDKIDSTILEVDKLLMNNPDFQLRFTELYANPVNNDPEIFRRNYISLLEAFGISFDGYSDLEKQQIVKMVNITFIFDTSD